MADQAPTSKRKRSLAAPSAVSTASSSPGSLVSMSTDTPDIPITRLGYRAPGRIGVPRMELFQEARLHPRLLTALSKHNLHRMHTPESLTTLSPTSTLDELEAGITKAELHLENIYTNLPNDLPSDRYELEVEHRTETITGFDLNFIKLHIYRPALRGGALPCIIYVHGGGGGGISICSADDKVHKRWCTSLAAQGLIVVNVEYRNARNTQTGFHPYPAALDDVCATVQYVHGHRDDLNVRNIVLQGDGGGGNLVLAAAIRAKREGWVSKIDGVYAYSPYISNAYNWSETRKLQELPSLIECHGCLLNCDYLAYTAHVYTPASADANNPLAWPYRATKEDLEGLPPHVISVDELTPLRSEGETYLRKLVDAGVNASGHIILGAVHAASVTFRQAVPEMNRDMVRGIAAFAKQV